MHICCTACSEITPAQRPGTRRPGQNQLPRFHSMPLGAALIKLFSRYEKHPWGRALIKLFARYEKTSLGTCSGKALHDGWTTSLGMCSGNAVLQILTQLTWRRGLGISDGLRSRSLNPSQCACPYWQPLPGYAPSSAGPPCGRAVWANPARSSAGGPGTEPSSRCP